MLLQRSDTLLHMVAARNAAQAAQTLIDSGFECTSRDRAEETALHVACRCNADSALKVLADARAMVSLQDASGQTSLQVARDLGDWYVKVYDTLSFLNICQYLDDVKKSTEETREQLEALLSEASTYAILCQNSVHTTPFCH